MNAQLYANVFQPAIESDDDRRGWSNESSSFLIPYMCNNCHAPGRTVGAG